MNKIEQFFEEIKKDMTVILATATNERVTMRVVSPVYFQDSVLIFTAKDSNKYSQLKENPRCCIAAGAFFAEATAKFCGDTMLADNKNLRDAYCEKFPDAFTEGAEFGGRHAEFILLNPTRLTGWMFQNDIPTEDGIPTIPFSADIN